MMMMMARHTVFVDEVEGIDDSRFVEKRGHDSFRFLCVKASCVCDVIGKLRNRRHARETFTKITAPDILDGRDMMIDWVEASS
jgi:hypothetical protein